MECYDSITAIIITEERALLLRNDFRQCLHKMIFPVLCFINASCWLAHNCSSVAGYLASKSRFIRRISIKSIRIYPAILGQKRNYIRSSVARAHTDRIRPTSQRPSIPRSSYKSPPVASHWFRAFFS